LDFSRGPSAEDGAAEAPLAPRSSPTTTWGAFFVSCGKAVDGVKGPPRTRGGGGGNRTGQGGCACALASTWCRLGSPPSRLTGMSSRLGDVPRPLVPRLANVGGAAGVTRSSALRPPSSSDEASATGSPLPAATAARAGGGSSRITSGERACGRRREGGDVFGSSAPCSRVEVRGVRCAEPPPTEEDMGAGADVMAGSRADDAGGSEAGRVPNLRAACSDSSGEFGLGPDNPSL